MKVNNCFFGSGGEHHPPSSLPPILQELSSWSYCKAGAVVSMRVAELGQKKGPAHLEPSTAKQRCHGRDVGCSPQGLPQPQPLTAQGLPELNVGFLCSITLCHQLLQSPLNLQTERFPADWEGKRRTGKRGCFCSHFGFFLPECRSPCCRTPMAFPQQVPQPSQATSLCNRLKSFGLMGAKKPCWHFLLA